eukprot:2627021-Rhodomonas_salina.1
MKWRKRIQELGGDKKEEAEKKDGVFLLVPSSARWNALKGDCDATITQTLIAFFFEAGQSR